MLQPSFCKLRTRLLQVYFIGNNVCLLAQEHHPRQRLGGERTEGDQPVVQTHGAHRLQALCPRLDLWVMALTVICAFQHLISFQLLPREQPRLSLCWKWLSNKWMWANSLWCIHLQQSPVQILRKVLLLIQEPLTHDPGPPAGLKQWHICRGRAEGGLELLPTQLEEKRDTTRFPSLHKY